MEIEVIRRTWREAIDDAAKKWKEHYHWQTQHEAGGRASPEWIARNVGDNGWIRIENWRGPDGGIAGLDTEWFYNQLLSLPDDATDENIVAILGDCNFARSILGMSVCDICAQKVEEIVFLNSRCDECGGVYLCRPCILKLAEISSSAMGDCNGEEKKWRR